MTDEEPTASSVPERRLRRRTQALIVVVVAPLLALTGLGATYLQRLPSPDVEVVEDLTVRQELTRIPGVVDVYDDDESSASVFLTVSDAETAAVGATRALEILQSRSTDARILYLSIPADERTDQGGSLAWNIAGDAVDAARLRADVDLWNDLAAAERVSHVSIDAVNGEVRSISGMPAYRDDRTIATAAELRAAWEGILAESAIEATLQVVGP